MVVNWIELIYTSKQVTSHSYNLYTIMVYVSEVSDKS
jgi:hypothetical protein